MNLRPRDRTLLGVLAALAAAAAFYVLALTPQRHEAARLERSIATAQTKLAGAQAAYTSGRAAQARLSATTREYGAARRAVPEFSNVPGLLRLLQHSADAAHVQLNTISLSGASPSSTSAGATTSSEDGANTIPVSLTFDGGFTALNRLVHRLDALVRVSHGHLRAAGPLVGISNVSLSKGSSASNLTVSLTATIYQYGSPSSVTGSGGAS